MVDQEEIVDRRREIVRHWWHISTAVPVILERLSRHDEYAFLDPLLTYRQRCKVIQEDIEAIRREAHAGLDVSEMDAKLAHADYIVRTEYIYSQSLQQGNLELAQKLNKDIAKAKGVQTDEPIVVKGDFLTIMMEATKKARATVEHQEQKVIDVVSTPVTTLLSPPVTPEEEPVEKKNSMPAFSILRQKPAL